MSIKVTSRVWKHSHQRSTTKLLLLALAEFANDDGVCWPGASKLAERIGETERYTRILIKRLINAGDLFSVPGGGRGHTTIYGVLTGLSKREREQLKEELQNRVTENSAVEITDTQETVISCDENSDLLCQETVISCDEGEAANSTAENGKAPQNRNANRHVEPSLEPRENRESVKRVQATSPPHSPAVMMYFEIFPGERLTAAQVTTINERIIGDYPRWRRALKYWAADGWSPQRISKICDRYDEEARANDRQVESHQSRGGGLARRVGRAEPAAGVTAQRWRAYKREHGVGDGDE